MHVNVSPVFEFNSMSSDYICKFVFSHHTRLMSHRSPHHSPDPPGTLHTGSPYQPNWDSKRYSETQTCRPETFGAKASRGPDRRHESKETRHETSRGSPPTDGCSNVPATAMESDVNVMNSLILSSFTLTHNSFVMLKELSSSPLITVHL